MIKETNGRWTQLRITDKYGEPIEFSQLDGTLIVATKDLVWENESGEKEVGAAASLTHSDTKALRDFLTRTLERWEGKKV